MAEQLILGRGELFLQGDEPRQQAGFQRPVLVRNPGIPAGAAEQGGQQDGSNCLLHFQPPKKWLSVTMALRVSLIVVYRGDSIYAPGL